MRIYGIFALKTYIVMALAVVTFSFVAELFSRIIPATLYGFFRDAGGAKYSYLLLQPHNRPKKFRYLIFDCMVIVGSIDVGLRVEKP